MVQVDGYIARRYEGQSSSLGSVLDPLADKCLISMLCVTLTMATLLPSKCMFLCDYMFSGNSQYGQTRLNTVLIIVEVFSGKSQYGHIRDQTKLS